jgi:hypothetical protein
MAGISGLPQDQTPAIGTRDGYLPNPETPRFFRCGVKMVFLDIMTFLNVYYNFFLSNYGE